MIDNAIKNALAVARNVYNAQKAWNPHAFDAAVFAFEDEIAQHSFEVKGIDFNRRCESALVWGRWDDEEYERRENDAYELYGTVNRYGTRYVAIDHKFRSRRG